MVRTQLFEQWTSQVTDLENTLEHIARDNSAVKRNVEGWDPMQEFGYKFFAKSDPSLGIAIHGDRATKTINEKKLRRLGKKQPSIGNLAQILEQEIFDPLRAAPRKATYLEAAPWNFATKGNQRLVIDHERYAFAPAGYAATYLMQTVSDTILSKSDFKRVTQKIYREKFEARPEEYTLEQFRDDFKRLDVYHGLINTVRQLRWAARAKKEDDPKREVLEQNAQKSYQLTLKKLGRYGFENVKNAVEDFVQLHFNEDDLGILGVDTTQRHLQTAREAMQSQIDDIAHLRRKYLAARSKWDNFVSKHKKLVRTAVVGTSVGFGGMGIYATQPAPTDIHPGMEISESVSCSYNKDASFTLDTVSIDGKPLGCDYSQVNVEGKSFELRVDGSFTSPVRVQAKVGDQFLRPEYIQAGDDQSVVLTVGGDLAPLEGNLKINFQEYNSGKNEFSAVAPMKVEHVQSQEEKFSECVRQKINVLKKEYQGEDVSVLLKVDSLEECGVDYLTLRPILSSVKHNQDSMVVNLREDNAVMVPAYCDGKIIDSDVLFQELVEITDLAEREFGPYSLREQDRRNTEREIRHNALEKLQEGRDIGSTAPSLKKLEQLNNQRIIESVDMKERIEALEKRMHFNRVYMALVGSDLEGDVASFSSRRIPLNRSIRKFTKKYGMPDICFRGKVSEQDVLQIGVYDTDNDVLGYISLDAERETVPRFIEMQRKSGKNHQQQAQCYVPRDKQESLKQGPIEIVKLHCQTNEEGHSTFRTYVPAQGVGAAQSIETKDEMWGEVFNTYQVPLFEGVERIFVEYQLPSGEVGALPGSLRVKQ